MDYDSQRPRISYIWACNFEIDETVGTIIGMSAIGFFIFGFITHWNEKAPERKKRREEQEKKATKKRQIREEELAAERDARLKSHIIMEVTLLDGGSNIRKHAGLGGALIGGLSGGFIGAIIGAGMKKPSNKYRQRFAVRYGDGHIETIDAEPGSKNYNKLMKFVKTQ